MPYSPLRELKPDGLKNVFAAFNLNDLSSDDEVPEQNHRGRVNYLYYLISIQLPDLSYHMGTKGH